MNDLMSKVKQLPDYGYVYILGFANGKVKVGKTKKPKQRLTQHQSTLGQIEDIIYEWVSPLHKDYSSNECKLIRLLGGTEIATYPLADVINLSRTLQYAVEDVVTVNKRIEDLTIAKDKGDKRLFRYLANGQQSDVDSICEKVRIHDRNNLYLEPSGTLNGFCMFEWCMCILLENSSDSITSIHTNLNNACENYGVAEIRYVVRRVVEDAMTILDRYPESYEECLHMNCCCNVDSCSFCEGGMHELTC